MGCGCGKSFSGSATNVVKPSNAPSNGQTTNATVIRVSNTIATITGQSPPQTPVARKVV